MAHGPNWRVLLRVRMLVHLIIMPATATPVDQDEALEARLSRVESDPQMLEARLSRVESVDHDLEARIISSRGDAAASRAGSRRPIGAKADGYDSTAFNYAPTVTLGSYELQICTNTTIDITINKKNSDIKIEDIKNTLVEETICGEFDEVWDELLESGNTFEDIIKKNTKSTAGNTAVLHRTINLDLKIMRDTRLDKWKVMFLKSTISKNRNDSESICEINDLSAIDVIDADFQFYAEAINEKNNSTEYRIFYLDCSDLSFNLKGWFDNEPLDQAHDFVDFYDFLMAPENLINNEADERYLQYQSTIHKEGFVKAPSGSIASDILSNLLYADDNEKIQNLLIADIKEKYTRLKKHHDDDIKEFDKRFSIFLNNK